MKLLYMEYWTKSCMPKSNTSWVIFSFQFLDLLFLPWTWKSSVAFFLLQVAERALYLWNNDHIENLIRQNRKVILPIIFPALENGRNHWNQVVQSLMLNILKIFSDVDPELFEECLCKFQEDQSKLGETRRKHETVWKRLEEIAASKAAGGAILVPTSKPTETLSS